MAFQKEAQKATHKMIDIEIQAALQECRLQESLSLKVRIGGLHPPWCSDEDTFEETITKLNDILQPINIKHETVS